MTETSPSQSSLTSSNSRGLVDSVFANLAQRNRRQLLGTLYELSPDSASPRQLADTLDGPGGGGSTQSDESHGEIALHHSHLPKLEEAGLVTRGDTDGIALTDHRAFRDNGIVAVLTGNADAAAESLDALFECLGHSRRRTVLDVLSHQLHPIHVETLAREVGARELDTTEQDVPPEEIKETIGSLYHVHLPKLADAELITYDRDDDTVAYEGHPDLRVPWMHSLFEPTFRAEVTGESSPREVETIGGREQVVSYGQSLFDRTDEELFCMITDTDLVEAGCLSRIRQASQRGVTVYLGIRDPTAREYIQENVPEVTLWEPRTDWLNLPVDGNAVGRLVLSDRSDVLLGTLKGSRDGDSTGEKAIIGEGTDNTLVVMIRQMVRPHLDHIDDSEELESQLPF